MTRYLVTGGAGFIGSHLVSHLVALGHRVRVLDDLSTGRAERLPDKADLVVASASNREAVAAASKGCDGVFHLAAIASVVRSIEDWVGTHAVNQTATVAILDAARRHGKLPVVFASSAAIYGDQCPATEDLRPAPRSAYGADKAGSELHLLAGWHSFGMPSAAMRFFNVFGPEQDPSSPYSGVISAFLARAIAGAPISVHGDGQQSRDFIHVDDVVRFLAAAMNRLREQPAHFVCNVCTGEATSIRQLAELVRALSGRQFRIELAAARPGDIRHSRGDPARAAELLNVRAAMPLNDGLRSTMQWMQNKLREAS